MKCCDTTSLTDPCSMVQSVLILFDGITEIHADYREVRDETFVGRRCIGIRIIV